MKILLHFLTSILLISCLNTNSQIIENIEVLQFYQAINKIDEIVIDVRTPQEFYSGHIEDATNIDFYADDFLGKLKILRKDVPIYVYCRSGGRSSRAAKKMAELGFLKVYNLIGGIEEWHLASYKVIKSKEQLTLKQSKFNALEVEEILNNNKVVLLEFSTEWCVPCKKMKPIISQIKKENTNIKVLSLDADVNKELIKSYKIKGVAVFVLFKNRTEIFRHVGIISKEELFKNILSLIHI